MPVPLPSPIPSHSPSSTYSCLFTPPPHLPFISDSLSIPFSVNLLPLSSFLLYLPLNIIIYPSLQCHSDPIYFPNHPLLCPLPISLQLPIPWPFPYTSNTYSLNIYLT